MPMKSGIRRENVDRSRPSQPEYPRRFLREENSNNNQSIDLPLEAEMMQTDGNVGLLCHPLENPRDVKVVADTSLMIRMICGMIRRL
jgi:hypothetical protein